MRETYDFRTFASMDLATFAFATCGAGWQGSQVKRQTDIVGALAARGVTQEQIGKALGIAPSNANKLFNPAAKTGKPRKLSYDEGVMLIEKFGLDAEDDDAPVAPMSVPVARLAVLYIAQRLGVKIDPDDARVEDLSLDIQAYSEFAASSQQSEDLSEARGWLRGRSSRPSKRA